jgi:uncharacterized protein HemY
MASERLSKLLTMEQSKPDDAFIKFAIAQEYVNTQTDELALPYFEALANKHPQYVPLYYHLGKLYERSGSFKQAREIYAAGVNVAKAANDLKTAGELQEALTLLEDE